MSVWTPLLPAVMVGTDKHSGDLPVWPGEVGLCAAEAAQGLNDAALRLLRTAAVLAPCALAGARPSIALTQGDLAARPAAADTRPPAPAALHELMRWALHENVAQLHQHLFQTLADAGYRLPTSLLPQALDQARRSTALRPSLLRVLDERGRWLAAQRDDWRFAAGASGDEPQPHHWTDGTLDQRRAFLKQERQSDPAAARERLARTLPELPAKERADLLAVLDTHLGPEDETLLERCRSDRSRDVREMAVRLLAQVDGSAFSLRAQARMAALLGRRPGPAAGGWHLDAPTAADPAWEADQITVTRPQNESLGERGWWLYQLVRQVPVAWWTRHTGLTVSELLDWAAAGDWTESLTRGWIDALSTSREPDWCEGLLGRLRQQGALAAGPQMAPMSMLTPLSAQLLHWLPVERREHHWLHHVEAAQLPLMVLLSACLEGHTLGLPLSRAMTRLVLSHAQSGKLKDDYGARPLLAEFCAVIHPDCLAEFATVTQFQRDGETASHADAMTAVAQVAALRQALLHLPRLTSRTP
jgi:hypothetical protein